LLEMAIYQQHVLNHLFSDAERAIRKQVRELEYHVVRRIYRKSN